MYCRLLLDLTGWRVWKVSSAAKQWQGNYTDVVWVTTERDLIGESGCCGGTDCLRSEDCILYTCTALQMYRIQPYRGTGVSDTAVRRYRCTGYSCTTVQLYPIHLYRGTAVSYTPVPRYSCILYICTAVQLYPIHLYRGTAVSYTPVPRYSCILYICTAIQLILYTVPRYRCIGYSCTAVQVYRIQLYRDTTVSFTPVPRYGCIL